MNELIDEFQRRARSCRELARESAEHSDDARCTGKADAYEHAAELVRQCLRESVHARFERDR